MALDVSHGMTVKIDGSTDGFNDAAKQAVAHAAKLEKELEQLAERNKRLEAQLEASQNALKRVSEKLDTARDGAASLGAASSDLEGRNRAAAQGTDALASSLAKAREQGTEPARGSIKGMTSDIIAASNSQRQLVGSINAVRGQLLGATIGMTALVQAHRMWQSAIDDQVKENRRFTGSVSEMQAAIDAAKRAQVSKEEEDTAALGVAGDAVAWTTKWAGVVFTLGQSYRDAEAAEKAMARAAEDERIANAQAVIDYHKALDDTLAIARLINSARQVSIDIALGQAKVASERIRQIYEETTALEGMKKAEEALTVQRRQDMLMSTAMRAKGQIQVERALDFFGLEGNKIVQGIPISPEKKKGKGGRPKEEVDEEYQAYLRMQELAKAEFEERKRVSAMQERVLEQRRDELTLEQSLLMLQQELADQQAQTNFDVMEAQAGEDPIAIAELKIARIDAETAAIERRADAELRLIQIETNSTNKEQQLARTKEVMIRKEAALRQQASKAYIAQINRETVERQTHAAMQAKVLDGVSRGWNASSNAIIAVMQAASDGSERSMRRIAGMQGGMEIVQVFIETAKAATAFASQNYVEGVEHVAAAVTHSAAAAVAFKFAANGSPGGGAGGSAPQISTGARSNRSFDVGGGRPEPESGFPTNSQKDRQSQGGGKPVNIVVFGKLSKEDRQNLSRQLVPHMEVKGGTQLSAR